MLDELLSCLVWQQLKGTALVKLQANNKIYAFPSFFVLSFYPIGPAKPRPTTSKYSDPYVLFVGNFPAGGFGKAVTLFMSCLSRAPNIIDKQNSS